MKHVVEIELTSWCNRHCHHCGHINMTRRKGIMTWATFHATLALCQLLGQTTVGLHHYGESTLHPHWLDMADACGDYGIKPWLYTNGDLLDEGVIAKMRDFTWDHIVISSHAPIERRIWLHALLIREGIPATFQAATNDSGYVSIAGQVEFYNPADHGQPPLVNPAEHCRFLHDEYACVLWNGDLVPCCFDYEGRAVFGNVHDGDAVTKRAAPFNAICSRCPGHPGNVI